MSGSTENWNGVSGDWFTAADWSAGVVPNGGTVSATVNSTRAFILTVGAPGPEIIGIAALTLADSHALLDVKSGSTLSASTLAINGGTIELVADTGASLQFHSLTIGAVAASALLATGNVTFAAGSTVALTGNGDRIDVTAVSGQSGTGQLVANSAITAAALSASITAVSFAENGGLTNTKSLAINAATTTLSAAVVNSGRMSVHASVAFSNSGSITDSGILTINARSFQNSGTINDEKDLSLIFGLAPASLGAIVVGSGATLSLSGTFATTLLNTVRLAATSTLDISGTINNAGNAINVGTVAGSISGGTVTVRGGVLKLATALTLSNVTLNSQLQIGAAGVLSVSAGDTINAGAGGTAITLNAHGSVDIALTNGTGPSIGKIDVTAADTNVKISFGTLAYSALQAYVGATLGGTATPNILYVGTVDVGSTTTIEGLRLVGELSTSTGDVIGGAAITGTIVAGGDLTLNTDTLYGALDLGNGSGSAPVTVTVGTGTNLIGLSSPTQNNFQFSVSPLAWDGKTAAAIVNYGSIYTGLPGSSSQPNYGVDLGSQSNNIVSIANSGLLDFNTGNTEVNSSLVLSSLLNTASGVLYMGGNIISNAITNDGTIYAQAGQHSPGGGLPNYVGALFVGGVNGGSVDVQGTGVLAMTGFSDLSIQNTTNTVVFGGTNDGLILPGLQSGFQLGGVIDDFTDYSASADAIFLQSGQPISVLSVQSHLAGGSTYDTVVDIGTSASNAYRLTFQSLDGGYQTGTNGTNGFGLFSNNSGGYALYYSGVTPRNAIGIDPPTPAITPAARGADTHQAMSGADLLASLQRQAGTSLFPDMAPTLNSWSHRSDATAIASGGTASWAGSAADTMPPSYATPVHQLLGGRDAAG